MIFSLMGMDGEKVVIAFDEEPRKGMAVPVVLMLFPIRSFIDRAQIDRRTSFSGLREDNWSIGEMPHQFLGFSHRCDSSPHS